MTFWSILWLILVALASQYAGIELYLLGVTMLALRDWEPYQ